MALRDGGRSAPIEPNNWSQHFHTLHSSVEGQNETPFYQHLIEDPYDNRPNGNCETAAGYFTLIVAVGPSTSMMVRKALHLPCMVRLRNSHSC